MSPPGRVLDGAGILVSARAAVVFLAALAAAVPASAAGPRILEFGGLSWTVRRTTSPSAPGPNLFRDTEAQVRVDPAGRLILSVLKRPEGWTACEIIARRATGYGTYSFEVGGGARDLDPGIVFGFFTWDPNPGLQNREIDIELSRWGDPGGPDGWFTVQPYEQPGNQDSFRLPPASVYRFEMRWEPGSVSFACRAEGRVVRAWTFRGEVPDPGKARIRFNLWLFNGEAPAGPGPYEVVVSNFGFVPGR